MIYCVEKVSSPADQSVYEKTTPAKIANPPSDEILEECFFLSVGSSNKFNYRNTNNRWNRQKGDEKGRDTSKS